VFASDVVQVGYSSLHQHCNALRSGDYTQPYVPVGRDQAGSQKSMTKHISLCQRRGATPCAALPLGLRSCSCGNIQKSLAMFHVNSVCPWHKNLGALTGRLHRLRSNMNPVGNLRF
jgi:hypothetical protein